MEQRVKFTPHGEIMPIRADGRAVARPVVPSYVLESTPLEGVRGLGQGLAGELHLFRSERNPALRRLPDGRVEDTMATRKKARKRVKRGKKLSRSQLKRSPLQRAAMQRQARASFWG